MASRTRQDEETSRSPRRSRLGAFERFASAGAGGALIALGTRRSSPWSKASMMVGGGYLMLRGISGRCYVSDVLGIRRSRGTEATASITIERPVHEVYSYWRDLENLPRFMKYLESVRTRANGQTHWVAQGPAGIKVEWDAEITEDEPDRAIAWRSLTGSDIEAEGRVDFRPAEDGSATRVQIRMNWDPKAGSLGSAMASFMGKLPEQAIKADLHCFKQVMESRDVVTTEGQSAGRPKSQQLNLGVAS